MNTKDDTKPADAPKPSHKAGSLHDALHALIEAMEKLATGDSPGSFQAAIDRAKAAMKGV